MIENQEFFQERGRLGQNSKSYKLLDNVTANGSGPWIDRASLPFASTHVFGNFVGNVKIFGSNEDVPPEDGGVQIGATITAPAIAKLDVPCRWIRAEVADWANPEVGDPSLSVLLHTMAG